MEYFSHIEGDCDIAMIDYAKRNSPTGICTWHENGLDHVLRYYNKNSKRVALDIGASYGFFTTGLAQNFKTVHSFEINPSVIPHLKINTSSYSNVNIHEYGLSDIEKSVLILDGTHSGFVKISDKGNVQSKVKTIDSFNFQDIDFIKMDVEGHEYEVFKGGVNTITINRPVIMFEWHTNRGYEDETKRQWVFNFLHNLNYIFMDYRHNDFLFIPN
jgi:FkbM family methyltransferase